MITICKICRINKISFTFNLLSRLSGSGRFEDCSQLHGFTLAPHCIRNMARSLIIYVTVVVAVAVVVRAPVVVVHCPEESVPQSDVLILQVGTMCNQLTRYPLSTFLK